MTPVHDYHRRTWKHHYWSVCGVLLGLVVGCGAQSRHAVLSIFFEGVPQPGAATSRLVMAGTAPIVRSGHEPFLKQECGACHASASGTDDRALEALRPGLCVGCHKDIVRQRIVMHAPVTAEKCLWCHAPHESGEPALLRERAPNLCFQCHPQSLLSSRTEEHLNGKSDCLVCHIGHGGADRRMIRRETAAPAQKAHRKLEGTR